MANETSEIQDDIIKNVSNLNSETEKEKKKTTDKNKDKISIRFSIQSKFLLFILILILLIIFVFSIQQLSNSKKELYQSANKNASLILENINTVSFNAMFNPEGIDDIMIADLISKYMDDKSKHIVEIVIYDDNNTVVGISGEKNQALKGKVLSDDISKNYINNGYIIKGGGSFTYIDAKNNFNYYLSPVSSEILNAPIGVIRLTLDTLYVKEAIANMTRKIIILALIFMTIALVLTIIMTRLISNPIKQIAMDVKKVGEGGLDHQINVQTTDEVGYLAKEFNKMTKNLKEAQKGLVKAASTQKEIEVAGQIQQNLLPTGLIKFDKIEAFGVSRAAKTVGGDYFDFFKIKDDLYASVISDVSGKGVPAGLIMTMIKTIVRTSEYEGIENPVSTVINKANKYLVNNSEFGKFATINFNLIDTSTGNIISADGGHGDYYFYSRHKNELYKLPLPEGNPPIGVIEDIEYAELAAKLDEDDFMCFFTDGITEGRNIKEEEYGDERIIEVLQKNVHKNAQGITEALMSDITEFIGEAPQHDDMTILTVKLTKT